MERAWVNGGEARGVMGVSGGEGWHGFVLTYPYQASHDGENFLAPSPTLGAPRNPTPPRKTLLLVNLPTTITIVFNKTCSNIGKSG